MNDRASRLARRRLKRLGVRLLTNTKVTAETLQGLKTSEGLIPTDTVVWTAGTTNNPFFSDHADRFLTDARGRVVVDEHLQTAPHIYVIGDNAATKYGGLALTAILNANYVAGDLIRRLKRRKRIHYRPFKPIQVVPVGHNYAVLQWGKLAFAGRLPAIIRALADLIGYTDVLGLVRAYSVWRQHDKTEEWCPACSRH